MDSLKREHVNKILITQCWKKSIYWLYHCTAYICCIDYCKSFSLYRHRHVT